MALLTIAEREQRGEYKLFFQKKIIFLLYFFSFSDLIYKNNKNLKKRKRRGYDIGRVVDLIFEYWLGRMKDSELEEYRHMKETTGLDKYAREFEDREWIKNALEEPDIFETDKAYRRFWSMTAGKRSIGRLRWRWVASLLIPLLVGGGVGLFVWWQPLRYPCRKRSEL